MKRKVIERTTRKKKLGAEENNVTERKEMKKLKIRMNRKKDRIIRQRNKGGKKMKTKKK